MNWTKPRTPTQHQGGLVVLHSDDGRLFDYQYFYPTIARAIYKNDQYKAKKPAIFTPAVNAGYIPDGIDRQYKLPMMNPEQLQEIVKNGGEVVSHCKYHIWNDFTPISQPVSAGATRIFYNQGHWARFKEGLTFTIEEGNLMEELLVTSVVAASTGDNYFDIDAPLKNSYTNAAKLHITYETAEELYGGNIDALASYGIECKHQVNPWYMQSERSKEWMKEFFDSVVTFGGTVDPNNFDLHDLHRTRDIRYFTKQETDNYLLDTRNNNTVLFVQAHGMPNKSVKENFEYLIDKTYELGLRIVTHSEAIEFLKSKL